MTYEQIIERDAMEKIAAVARRLYSQDRMSGDVMRNAAQMLHAALDSIGAQEWSLGVEGAHATYDARLRD